MIRISLNLLLTMCFSSFAVGTSKLTVIQTPRKIHLSTGDCAEITCVWENSIVRCRVSWYLVNKENITQTISSQLSYASNVTQETKNVLEIKSASVNDTGIYYCEIVIEIPFYQKVCGNGTTVIVEEKEADSLEKRELARWAIIPFLVAVGSFCLCYKKKWHTKLSGSAQLPMPAGRHRKEQMLEVAELQGRNESTNEAAEENSRNSAEWAVSTLYESLDFCNESRGKYDKSTATIVASAAEILKDVLSYFEKSSGLNNILQQKHYFRQSIYKHPVIEEENAHGGWQSFDQTDSATHTMESDL